MWTLHGMVYCLVCAVCNVRVLLNEFACLIVQLFALYKPTIMCTFVMIISYKCIYLTFCSFLMWNFMIEYFLGRKNEYKNIFKKKKFPTWLPYLCYDFHVFMHFQIEIFSCKFQFWKTGLFEGNGLFIFKKKERRKCMK